MKQKLYSLKNYIRSILGYRNGLSKIDNDQQARSQLADIISEYGIHSVVKAYDSNVTFTSVYAFKNLCRGCMRELELAPKRRAKQKERMKQYLN